MFRTRYLLNNNDSGDLPLYTFNEDVLSGLSIRYFSSPFNPVDAVENLAKVINSSEALKKIFAKDLR